MPMLLQQRLAESWPTIQERPRDGDAGMAEVRALGMNQRLKGLSGSKC